MPKWVKVEFYGLTADTDTIPPLDTLGLADTLARAFGFTHIDHLSATKVQHNKAGE